MAPSDAPTLVISLETLAQTPRARAEVGGKAAALARLWAAGVRVPPGWVLTTAACAQPASEPRALAALRRAVDQAGWQTLVVRSSSTLEDRAAGAAPGVFASRVGVAPAQLDDAVRAVWASAHAPLVRAYAEARGAGPVAMAVLVQPAIGLGQADALAGVVYTRLPGRPESDEMLLETYARAGAPAQHRQIPRSPAADGDSGGEREPASPLAAARVAELAAAALGAEDAIAATRGADVEWVATPEQLWIVQARPIVHPERASAPAFPLALLAMSRAQPELVWRWDVRHNPDPLSPAQAGLVEHMDEIGQRDARMRVVGGYLYYGARSAPAANPDEAAESLTAAELDQRFRSIWLPEMEAALRAAERPEAAASDAGSDGERGTELDAVLAAYARFYALYAGPLASALRAGRRALPAYLRARYPRAEAERLAAELLSDPSDARLETALARAARGQISRADVAAMLGPLAPAWDVATPTYGERPQLIEAALERAGARALPDPERAARAQQQLAQQLSAEQRSEFERVLALARRARDLGELDDRLFGRAQTAVRRALLRVAARWQLADADDIFYLPLHQTTDWAKSAEPPPATAVRRLAQAGRRARARQQAWSMPLAFANGAPLEDAQAPAGSGEAGLWRGRGTGARVRGTCVRLAELSEAITTERALADDAILVVATLTPAMSLLLHQVRALVAEHGGLLDHGAAMARELGLPCVVDCAGAWRELRDGDAVLVDGDAGVVLRVS
ncbi:PEP/pyruvate-binding domain-containing protein [Haliangium ochraceum]|nr:PEP/pyruvate-binding domain-containing protein [Haliangium ochraceum]